MKATVPKYEDYERKIVMKNITVEAHTLNGAPVCCTWWGDKKHPRQCCKFLLTRRMGTIDVCGLLGEDMIRDYNTPATVHERCPIWNSKG